MPDTNPQLQKVAWSFLPFLTLA